MPQDFTLNRSMYRDAYQRGMTLSAFLETLDPSHDLSVADRRILGEDAFTRQLARLDIRTQSVPELGMAAHSFDRFWDDQDGNGDERAVLAAEWLSRQYRQAARVVPRGQFASRMPQLDRRILSTNNPLSDVLWPAAQDGMMRYQELEPSVLSYVVGRTRGVTSEVFQAFYLTDATVEAAARMKRVSEYGEVPPMQITGGDHSIKVKKYGRRLQASYESMRRMSMDLIAWAVQYIAAKADNDKFLTALDVIINGDGNTSTSATSTNGSTLDGAAGGALTLKMWLAWGMLWTRPHKMDVVIGTNASVLSLLLLNAGSANLPPSAIATANGAIGAITLARPVYGNIVAINDANATANVLYGIDSRYTLELVSEVGADIVETDRIIQRQYEEVVLTESVGFDVMTLGQNRALAYTA